MREARAHPRKLRPLCLPPRRGGPIHRTVDDLAPGEPRRGSGALRRESGGVARPSLHPRLFTENPAGVRPWDASRGLIHRCLRRPRQAPVFLGRKTTATGRTARTSATISTVSADSLLRPLLALPDDPRGDVAGEFRRVQRSAEQQGFEHGDRGDSEMINTCETRSTANRGIHELSYHGMRRRLVATPLVAMRCWSWRLVVHYQCPSTKRRLPPPRWIREVQPGELLEPKERRLPRTLAVFVLKSRSPINSAEGWLAESASNPMK